MKKIQYKKKLFAEIEDIIITVDFHLDFPPCVRLSDKKENKEFLIEIKTLQQIKLDTSDVSIEDHPSKTRIDAALEYIWNNDDKLMSEYARISKELLERGLQDDWGN